MMKSERTGFKINQKLCQEVNGCTDMKGTVSIQNNSAIGNDELDKFP